jgi:hypothetical protein
MKKYGLIIGSVLFFGAELLFEALFVGIDIVYGIFGIVIIGVFLSSIYRKINKDRVSDNEITVIKKPVDYRHFEFYDDPKQYEYDPEDFKFDPDDFTYE